jgi:hypothetical protein
VGADITGPSCEKNSGHESVVTGGQAYSVL